MTLRKVTEEIAERIIAATVNGEHLKKALKNQQVTPDQFYNFLADHPLVERRYHLAQQTKAEILVEEIIEIADTEVDVYRAKVMTEARKWYASKMKPLKFGDRLDVNITSTVDITAALNDAKSRVTLPVRCQERILDAELVETKQVTHEKTAGYKPVLKPESVHVDAKNSTETDSVLKDAHENSWDFISS